MFIKTVLLAIIAVAAFPQTQQQMKLRTSLYGVVKDDRGTPLRGVRVSVKGLTVITSDDGKYSLEGVPAGNLSLTFSMTGYSSSVQRVTVRAGELKRLDYTFPSQGRSEELNELGLPLVQLTRSGINLFASVSPDRQKIALEVLDRGTRGYDIKIVDAGTVSGGLFSSLEEDESNPQWSPRGDAMTFSSYSYKTRYRIWVRGIGQSKGSEFIDQGLTPSWSPNGEWIVYAKLDPKSDWHIWKKKVGSNEAVQLTSGDSQEQYPCWSIVDGREKIVFASSRGRDGKLFELWTMNPDGGDAKQLTSSGLNLIGPSVSPDGTTIACWDLKRTGSNSVYTLASDGSNVRKLVSNSSNPQWLDNNTILFCSKITGQGQIWKTSIR